MGDKRVLKTLIKAGEGYDRPNEGALVKGKLNKRFQNQIPLSKWLLLSHLCIVYCVYASKWCALACWKMEQSLKEKGQIKNLLSIYV